MHVHYVQQKGKDSNVMRLFSGTDAKQIGGKTVLWNVESGSVSGSMKAKITTKIEKS